jgi:putative ABC transport system ATP-binding protein
MSPAFPRDEPGAPSASGPRPVLLETENLSKIYRMGEVEVPALLETSIAVREGELGVILGPSGSGKSTLLNILGGIDTPTSGRVLFRGRDLSKFGASELTLYRRRSVGFVFQFYNLIPSLTALENVEMPCEISPAPLDAAEVMREVGLGDRLHHFPSQLSGGEQQRVAIARAVAKNPELLLCDEPTGALDYETGKQILRLLRDVNARTGKTMLLITHNAAIGRIADRVFRMRSGRVAAVEVNERKADPEEIEW